MRTGVFQFSGGGLNPAERLSRLKEVLSKNEFELLVCPESFMSGYNIGNAIAELAEPTNGPFAKQVAELARTHNTAVVYGYPERDGKHIYNSAACISATGELVANHRKLMLPPGFEPEYFQAGYSLTLFELNGMRCGMLICYDAEFPESIRACADAGAQVIIVPTALGADWGHVALQVMPTRAFENGVWLIYANNAGNENGASYFGGSCIVAPDGKDVARAGSEEQIISVDLDIEQVQAAQERLPYIEGARVLRKIIDKQS